MLVCDVLLVFESHMLECILYLLFLLILVCLKILDTLLDADYTQADPSGSSEDVGGVLMIRLPCKELENLLLLSPETVANAASEEGDRRSQYTHAEVASGAASSSTGCAR